MNYTDIAVEVRGPICRLMHNRPEVRNAERANLLDELDHALTKAGDDDAIKVVIIGGKGDHFSAGHDMRESREKRSDFTVEQRYEYEHEKFLGYCLNIK